MLQVLETIREEALGLKTSITNGFDLLADDFDKLLARIEDAIGMHTATTAALVEGTGLLPDQTTGDLGEAVHVIGEVSVADPAPAAPGA